MIEVAQEHALGARQRGRELAALGQQVRAEEKGCRRGQPSERTQPRVGLAAIGERRGAGDDQLLRGTPPLALLYDDRNRAPLLGRRPERPEETHGVGGRRAVRLSHLREQCEVRARPTRERFRRRTLLRRGRARLRRRFLGFPLLGLSQSEEGAKVHSAIPVTLSTMPALSERAPVRELGRYALYGKIASGGMATVHFGRLLGPVGFSRTVAIKRLHPHLAEDADFVSMFLDEARLAARIRHPNVVSSL